MHGTMKRKPGPRPRRPSSAVGCCLPARPPAALAPAVLPPLPPPAALAPLQVLVRLLPVVIGKLRIADPGVQKKVLEILSHVNKRTKAAPKVQLPLPQLVALFAAPDSTPLQRNFALVYVEAAAARAPPAARLEQLGPLLAGVGGRPAAHQAMLLRLAAQCLEQLATGGPQVGGAALVSSNSSGGGVCRGGAAAAGGSGRACRWVGAASPTGHRHPQLPLVAAWAALWLVMGHEMRHTM